MILKYLKVMPFNGCHEGNIISLSFCTLVVKCIYKTIMTLYYHRLVSDHNVGPNYLLMQNNKL